MKKIFKCLILSVLLIGCNDEEKQSARLEVRLTDAPGDYEEVNIDIQGVEIHTAKGSAESGWMSLDVQQGIYNLLELTNGLDVLLASAELPAGRVSQIRLVLGDNNSIKIDGQEIALKTPAGQQSGLTLNVHAELIAGITYTILLDFDAARSIVKTAHGNYNLKPVIRSITEATSGAIKGVVDPAESAPAVFAIVEEDTVASAYTDETGGFLLRGVPAGTFTVSLAPKDGYQPLEITGVDVAVGTVTDLDTLTIE